MGTPPKYPIFAKPAIYGKLGGSWKLAPRGPREGGVPGGVKKCTFFWVFNNSPSRDRMAPRAGRDGLATPSPGPPYLGPHGRCHSGTLLTDPLLGEGIGGNLSHLGRVFMVF